MKLSDIPDAEDQASPIQALLAGVAKSLVARPECVRVKTIVDADSLVVLLLVAESDLDQVVGRDGRTARSLRAIVSALSKKIKQPMRLAIQSDETH